MVQDIHDLAVSTYGASTYTAQFVTKSDDQL